MATAHLIYGYIGAGKTTYAQDLEDRLHAVRFTTDEWISTLYSEDESQIADFDVLVRRVGAVMEPLWCRSSNSVSMSSWTWALGPQQG